MSGKCSAKYAHRKEMSSVNQKLSGCCALTLTPA